MNITFDLETLGNTSQAPITQIGAVKFDDDGNILDTFIRNIDLNSLEKYNFKLDYNTIMWWMNQEDKAIKSVYGEALERVNITQALHEFLMWIGELGEYRYWSHTTFDPPILNNHFIQTGRKNPIPFRLHRDIRTLTDFAGKILIERKGIYHNALDDCIYQAEYITEGLKRIKWKKERDLSLKE